MGSLCNLKKILQQNIVSLLKNLELYTFDCNFKGISGEEWPNLSKNPYLMYGHKTGRF